jgi:hypothetical protein
MLRRSVYFWRLVVLGGIVVLGSAGCSGSADSARTADRVVVPQAPSSLMAEVDSIEAPSRIGTTDTLSVRLQGTVGPNGCYSFNRMAVERAPRQIRLVPLVSRATQGGCTMAVVPLDETVRVDPPFVPGTLTITVPQPNRENAATTVEVTAPE